jgi:hypothetical protein
VTGVQTCALPIFCPRPKLTISSTCARRPRRRVTPVASALATAVDRSSTASNPPASAWPGPKRAKPVVRGRPPAPTGSPACAATPRTPRASVARGAKKAKAATNGPSARDAASPPPRRCSTAAAYHFAAAPELASAPSRRSMTAPNRRPHRSASVDGTGRAMLGRCGELRFSSSPSPASLPSRRPPRPRDRATRHRRRPPSPAERRPDTAAAAMIRLAQTRSTIVAMPMPPPMQRVTSAVLLSARSSSSTAVPSRQAPVAPSG